MSVSPSLVIPAAELSWRFSRSSGPGGQHVNTADSRVELMWNILESQVLSDQQRAMLQSRLRNQLVNGILTITAQEQRSQLRNREIAIEKLGVAISAALAPPAPPRRPTKPTRGSQRRHKEVKQQRSAIKSARKRPPMD